jgi:murein DD-endopeptidase MepM/ murein hydrolase activator NlpD
MKVFPILIAASLAVLPATAPALAKSGHTLAHPANGKIVKGFGFVTHPLLKTRAFHPGVDYLGRVGSLVRAASSGRVVVAGREGAYGNYIRIDHGHGLRTAYAHLLNYKVKPGQRVRKGQVIGWVGNTGLSSQPHLHFEVIRRSHFVNPVEFMRQRGRREY